MRGELKPGSTEYTRHMSDLHMLLGRRWESHILAVLSRRPMRCSKLLRALRSMPLGDGWTAGSVCGISDVELREALVVMQDLGLVMREVDGPSTHSGGTTYIWVPALGVLLATIAVATAMLVLLRSIRRYRHTARRLVTGNTLPDGLMPLAFCLVTVSTGVTSAWLILLRH